MKREIFVIEKVARIVLLALFCINVINIEAADPKIVVLDYPALGEFGYVQGYVVLDGLSAANVEKYAVIAMLYATWDGGSGYYVKPYANDYKNAIDANGYFSIRITTGGNDENVPDVYFFLVEKSLISDADVANLETMNGKYLAMEYVDRRKPPNPLIITPNRRPGIVASGTKITLSYPNNASIRYTTDGSNPSTSSTARTYNNEEFSVPVDGSLLVKATFITSESYNPVFSFLWLPEEKISTSLWGLGVSLALNGEPFGMPLSEAITIERMQLVPKLTKWVRTFGTVNNGNEYINKIAKGKGLRTMIGLHITDDIPKNNEQVEGLRRILQMGPAAPDLICVGNEVNFSGYSSTTLETYIDKVRDLILSQGLKIPIGSVDVVNNSWNLSVLGKIDFVGVNIYCGTWDNVPESQMLSALKQTYAATLSSFPSKCVIITECGTPYSGGSYSVVNGTQTASIQKAVNFIKGYCDWIKYDATIPSFYFEAYDEPTKSQNGGHPIEQYFGIMNGDLEIHSFYKDIFDVIDGTGRLPESGLKLYPGLFTDVINVVGAEGATLKIISENGVLLKTQKITNSYESVWVADLPVGMYFFIFEKEGSIKTLKAVKM